MAMEDFVRNDPPASELQIESEHKEEDMTVMSALGWADVGSARVPSVAIDAENIVIAMGISGTSKSLSNTFASSENDPETEISNPSKIGNLKYCIKITLWVTVKVVFYGVAAVLGVIVGKILGFM